MFPGNSSRLRVSTRIRPILGIQPPIARIAPMSSARIPACIDPPYIRLHSSSHIFVESENLIFLGCAGKLGLTCRLEIMEAKLRRYGLTVFSRHNMLEYPAAPDIDTSERSVFVSVNHKV